MKNNYVTNIGRRGGLTFFVKKTYFLIYWLGGVLKLNYMFMYICAGQTSKNKAVYLMFMQKIKIVN